MLATAVYILGSIFYAGLGNSMFQFVSVLGIAMSKNMNIIVNCKSEINLLFKLNVDLRLNTDICITKSGSLRFSHFSGC
jgi:hypothetical protein